MAVPEVVAVDSSVVEDSEVDSVVDSCRRTLRLVVRSEDSGTVAVDSSPGIVVSDVDPESVIVVTSAGIVTSVVLPPAVRVVTN